jgi:hypothetical protein
LSPKIARVALLGPTFALGALALRFYSGETYVYLYDFTLAALTFSLLGGLILLRRPRHAIGL